MPDKVARNREIVSKYRTGETLESLSAQYGLSEAWLRKIVDRARDAQSVFDSMRIAGERAIDRIGDAFEDFVTTGKLNFRSLTSSILADMARIAAHQAFAPIKNALTSSFSDALSGMFSFKASAKGNVFVDAPGLGKYLNKIVDRPTIFPFARGIGLMGEAGAEAIMPLKRGPDGRLGVAAYGAGSANITVNVDARGTRAEGDPGAAMRLGEMVGHAVRSILIEEQRPGGLLATA